ncbi:MAG: heme-binding domain-containing protein [Phycisphaera sp.]|nr:heme-binding domain-containing protein [Phycisphaera sp.]
MRGVVLDGDAAYRTPPITVDCRATLTSRNGYNVLVASDTKKSGAHWELFTMNGSGTLTAYLPGMKPDHVRSTAMVCDGKAHTLTMLYEPRRVRLLVDGKAVADQAVESLERPTVSGGLAVGRLVEGGIGCTGLIEWASVLRGVRDASTEPMIKPAADDATLLLWRADQPDKPVSNTAAPSDAPSKSPVGPTAATFPIDRTPLHPEQWSLTNEPINKNRLYDFYARQADYFRTQPRVPGAPELLAEYPGLDGGTFGHWGHESDKDWASDAWNRTDLGTLQSGVFRGGGVTVPRGVCVRLGDHGELSACFNPDTLTYDAVWSGGFVKYSPVRHGFMQGIRPDGEMKPRPSSKTPDLPFVYHGYYRFGKRIAFAYRLGDREVLDMPWAANGEFMRMLLPVVDGRVEDLLRRASAQWPQRITTPITLGAAKPYAVDHIGLPTDNPWRALLFCGGHAFLPDGSAVVCTMQGDVWRVTGFTHPSTTATWRRIASGLHHALGIVADNDGVFVLGRDQITRLHDLNGDGETDYYECFSNAYVTSPAGHDFICGLQRDKAGNFYIASGNQGVVRISPDGKHADVIATGFRNPDGLGITDDGTLTVPCSEGEWTPASMICAVPTRAASDAKVDTPVPHYGYRGPQRGQPPVLPLAYLPRGVDNSSGGQAYIDSDQWGPLKGQIVHTSFGFGTHFLVLRDTVDGQTQGAVVPLPGEFRSGVHRARFNPVDGQLYVSGMQGWVSFTPDDGCFARVRYTGDPVQLPVGFHVHRNGVSITFSAPLDRKVAADAASHFAQCWNYRYSSGYGSAEFSPRHPGTPGHDVLAIADAVVLDDGRTLFLHIPDLQPVNQLHLRVRAAAHVARDVFVTVHKLGEPFTAWPGYKPSDKVVTPHPIVADMARLTGGSTNPYRRAIEGARPVTIETGSNLTFATRSITVHAGEAIALTLANPDVVPHNWVLARPDSLQRVGDAADHYIAHPDAAANQYVPPSDDVIVHTDITPPNDRFTIYFHAPDTPGVYPYLCTFPGHWRVMNGTMTVEPR